MCEDKEELLENKEGKISENNAVEIIKNYKHSI